MWDIPAIDTFDLLKDIYKLDKQKYETTKNELIIRGDYDRILIRPRGIVTQVMIFQFDTFKIIRTLQSIIIMLIALINLKIKWNIYKVFVLIFSLSSSTLIFFGVFLLGASYCFFQFKA